MSKLLNLVNCPACSLCELHKEAKSVCVPTIHLPGSCDPREEDSPLVLFVGQNPGFHEDQKNEPFVGKSGDLVKQAYVGGTELDERSAVFLTNGVRCYIPANETPRPKNYKVCSDHLRQDLNSLFSLFSNELKIVITLGAPATSSFYKDILGEKKTSLTAAFNKNGRKHHLPDKGDEWSFFLFSTYHPAAVLRNNNYINAVESHMQLVSDCLDGTMAVPSDPLIVPTRSPRS